MRLVHFAELSGTGHVVPRCGSWGGMDTDWTDIADAVTCAACSAAGAPPDADRAAGEALVGERATDRPRLERPHPEVATARR